MRITELPYWRDTAGRFSFIAAEPWSLFLDSGHPYIDSGRYDIIASRPYKTLVTCADETTVSAGGQSHISAEDPFLLVKQALGARTMHRAGLPFSGGALGYFGYDMARRMISLPQDNKAVIPVPDMAVGIYDWALITDHQARRCWLTGQGRDERTEAEWDELLELFSRSPEARQQGYGTTSAMRSFTDKSAYLNALHKIKQYIRDGDCYQVNLTQQFSFSVSGDAWDIYRAMRESNPAPFSAFFRLPEAAILSSSPERFISVNHNRVETRPIKGTIRRSPQIDEDRILAKQLMESGKDRAENLMIVDLLRNDIGKSCEIGSVEVPSLFALESYATVHHLVSTVTGHLARGRHALDLLRDCFPGGSITGAPKRRTMQIIEEVEPHRRGVYCGALGYIGFDGNMDTNITIRTLLHHDDQIYCWAGGGIVADSDPEAEYRECFTKVESLLKLFMQEARPRNGTL